MSRPISLLGRWTGLVLTDSQDAWLPFRICHEKAGSPLFEGEVEHKVKLELIPELKLELKLEKLVMAHQV